MSSLEYSFMYTVDVVSQSLILISSRSCECVPRSTVVFTSCGSLIPFARANAQWVIHGLNLALKFTLQSQFSVSPFVFIVLRGTTFICTLTFSSPRFIT